MPHPIDQHSLKQHPIQRHPRYSAAHGCVLPADETPESLPTLSEIAAACRAIQGTWSDEERERRTVQKVQRIEYGS